MPLIADRFLRQKNDDGEVVDLATGEMVRLAIGPPGPTHDRASVCDRLSGLRHPLLLPLVDYGMHGRQWFEAHARLPALRAPGVRTSRTLWPSSRPSVSGPARAFTVWLAPRSAATWSR